MTHRLRSFASALFSLAALGCGPTPSATQCPEPAAAAEAAPAPHQIPSRDNALQISDESMVMLTPRVSVNAGEHVLSLYHGGGDLAQSLENQLSTIEEFAVQVADFEHEGQRFRTTVMTVKSDGTVEAWARNEEDTGCVSPMLAAPAEGSSEVREISFVVLAVDLDSHLVIADPYPLVYVPPMAPPTRRG
ncbi:MAG: hypothetical protein AAF799_34380 [Myxococcota bacterium]